MKSTCLGFEKVSSVKEWLEVEIKTQITVGGVKKKSLEVSAMLDGE
jgi:hypothetical protein